MEFEQLHEMFEDTEFGAKVACGALLVRCLESSSVCKRRCSSCERALFLPAHLVVRINVHGLTPTRTRLALIRVRVVGTTMCCSCEGDVRSLSSPHHHPLSPHKWLARDDLD